MWKTAGHSLSPTVRQLLWPSLLKRSDLLLQFFGIIGNPVGHSLSPALHNSGFAAAGLDSCYVPLLVDDAKEFLAGQGRQFAGFSVTIPHKVCSGAVMELPVAILGMLLLVAVWVPCKPA